MIEIREARLEDANDIVETLREWDKTEFSNLNLDPLQGILESIETSTRTWTALVDGKVGCIWGIENRSALSGVHIWLVGTPLVSRHRVRFLKESKNFVLQALKQYGYSFVYATSPISYRWLEWLGFVATGEVCIGDLKTIRYEMRGL